MSAYAGYATDDVAMLEREITAFANGKIGEVNGVKDYANTAVSGVSGITGEISGLGTAANDIVIDVAKGVSEFKDVKAQDESSFLDAIASAAPYFELALTDTMTVIDRADKITTELDKTIKSLDEEGLPEFSKISPEVDYTVAQLTGNLKSLTYQVSALSSALNGFEKSLSGDVRSITGIIQEISDNVFDVIYSLDDFSIREFIKDVSADSVDPDGNMLGIIASCVNTGYVSGGENTGGIVGSMNVSAVPEIDSSITDVDSTENGFSYKMIQYRDIVSSCRNFGNIVSTGNNTGGIAGKETIGAISDCQAYGSVRSSEGLNTGGIAGNAQGLVTNCFVKSSVSGSDYVGGITGTGNGNKLVLQSSTVKNNFASVSVASGDIHYGAISGSDAGNLLYNYFAEGNLNGVGEYSMEFSAAPAKLADIYELENCPDEFKWSSEKLASAASPARTVSRAGASREFTSYTIILIMLVLAAVIFLLIWLLRKDSAKKPAAETEYKQPWKDYYFG